MPRPYLHNHRRRHSWPFGSPAAQLREKRIARYSRVPDPAAFEEQYLAPIVSTDLLEDDAASAGIVRSQTTRSHRWFSSKHADRSEPAAAPAGSLRRIIRPPLEKARSLFVVPTTTGAGEQVMISCWVPLSEEAEGVIAMEDEDGVGDGIGYLRVEKNHRRCHSEQPRSWRAPSARLWTLLEE